MRKIRMIFYADGVEVNDKKYDKNKVLEFLKEQRKSCKTKVKIKSNEHYTTYKMKVYDDVIEVIFPYIFAKENDIFEDVLETWSNNDRRGFIRKLKVLGFILGVGGLSILASKAHSHIEEEYGSMSNFIESISDDIKFYATNGSELKDIKILENELRGHTGYGEVAGYRQTVGEHLNGYCNLDKANTYSEMEKAVLEYCNENDLGKEVYKSAMEKYEYLKDNDKKAAYEIDLSEVYKKTKTKKIGN